MNKLNRILPPGSILAIDPETILDPILVACPTFQARGGPGLDARDQAGWEIRGVWLADQSHGIIASDMIVGIIQIPEHPLAPLTILEEMEWIQ